MYLPLDQEELHRKVPEPCPGPVGQRTVLQLALRPKAFRTAFRLTGCADSIADVPSPHWARRYFEMMRDIEILSGRDDGQFAPAPQPVTWAEFAKMLALTLRLEASGQGAVPFADVPDDWSMLYIGALYQ